MTGPEHYKEAERLLRAAHEMSLSRGGGVSAVAVVTAEAQVHAILALTAATLDGAGRRLTLLSENDRKWLEVDAWSPQ